MSGLVVKNNNELWFNNNKLSTSIGTKGLYMDNNRNLFFNDVKIASGNLNNALGLHLINSELAYDGIKFGSELNVLIRSLFANNEQGFAFDFNDLSTMYQDAAGTIPVTGVGQPVGLVLDKSKPILSNNISILGSSFLTVNDWVISNAGISVTEVNGTLRIAKGTITPQHIYKVFNCEVNVLYRLTIKYKNHTGNNVRAFICNTTGGGSSNTLFQPLQTFTSVEGELTSLFISSSNGHSILIDSQNAADSSIDITQISIVKVSNSGNHAYQSTSAKRPILQQNATTGAYYLLFDGVDDCLVTGSVDFSATNDFTVLSGNTKLNDTTGRYLFSICNTASIDSTMFALWVGGGGGSNVGTESFTSKHPATLFNIMAKSNYPSFNAPKSTVVTLMHDNTNKKHYFTLNRAVSQQSAILNTNKLGNYPIYIGSRTSNDYFFNGHLYSLIGIARLVTPTEITNAENAIAKTVGVTL